MSEQVTTQLDAVTAFANNTTSIYAAKASGLYRSDDKGLSWDCMTEDAQTGGSVVTSVEVIHDTVLAGLNGAVLHTADDGQSWKVMALGLPPPLVSAIVASPNYKDDETIFAGTAEDGVFVSTDDGQTWTPWNFGLIDLDIYCLALSPNFGTDTTIYAGTETGIFCSHNRGKSWHDVPFPVEYAPVLSLALTGNGQMFAGTDGNGLFMSDNMGQNWSPMLQSTALDIDFIHQMKVDEDQLVILTDDHLLQIQLSEFAHTILKTFTDEQALTFGKTDVGWLIGYIDGRIESI